MFGTTTVRKTALVLLSLGAVALLVAGASGAAGTQDSTLCLGDVPTILGTSADDILVGTESDDIIVSFSGNDTIDGLGGDDLICGGDGTTLSAEAQGSTP